MLIERKFVVFDALSSIHILAVILASRACEHLNHRGKASPITKL